MTNIKSDKYILDGLVELDIKMRNSDFSVVFNNFLKTQGWSYVGSIKPLTKEIVDEWSFFDINFIKDKLPKCSKCINLAFGSYFDDKEEIKLCASHFIQRFLEGNKESNYIETDRIILSNKVQCRKCKDIIESKHRYDFVKCKCGAIAIDGGKNYLKRSAKHLDDIIELSEYTEGYNENP